MYRAVLATFLLTISSISGSDVISLYTSEDPVVELIDSNVTDSIYGSDKASLIKNIETVKAILTSSSIYRHGLLNFMPIGVGIVKDLSTPG